MAPVISPPSFLELFWGATLVVKIIMLGLVAASFWSWTLIFYKMTRLKMLNRKADTFEESFWSGGSLEELYDHLQERHVDPMSSVFCAAMREWRRSLSKGISRSQDIRVTLQQRIERVMNITLGREMESLERYMGFLASLGSNGMIVGLFGTVLGVMNSFQSIAIQQNANLAVVAPGIAEALFATAIGLVAAIPASIAHIKISSDIQRFGNRLETFSQEFSAIISRQFEEIV